MRPSLKLLLLLLSGLGLSAHGGEIINGEKVPEGEMLYMASVQDALHQHICGGFLISEDYVLTAAHCDDNSEVKSVVLGTHDLKNNKTTMRFTVMKCKHESYNERTNEYDIMLLKLDGKVRLQKQKVEIINVPKSEVKMKDNDICQVAGWGLTSQGGSLATKLQKVDVRFMNLDKCKKSWGHLPDTVMCAGGFTKDGKGFCQGDSGGPLVCNGIPVGIVSYNNNNRCNYPDVPNVYTNLSKYTGWIDKTMKKKKC